MSLLTHGPFEILRHYQGAKHFATDQRLHLEIPGRIVLNLNGNLLPNNEVERQRARIMRTPLVRRDRDYPFCEYLITADAGVVDPQLSILAKILSVLEVLRLGGSYELVDQLWHSSA